MPDRRSTCLYRRILQLVPRVFKTDPWQIMLCIAWLGMGVATAIAMAYPVMAASVVDDPLSWKLLRGLWSACFLFGALFQLHALQWPRDGLLERLGISLAGVGCVVYGLSLFAAGRPSGYALAVVFLIIAFGHLVVLLAAEVARRLTARASQVGGL